MYRTIKQFVSWLCDGIERVVWLKLTELAIFAAFITWLIVYLLDHSVHPLDQFGYMWMVGGGIVCYLVIASLTLWARSIPDEEVCPGCGHPVAEAPHVDPDLAGLQCNRWY